uniref:Uncharacterized protein n=1 Tax=Panagrolaimus davidi TaxID=227884 RepID=A0A914PH85_9BILA
MDSENGTTSATKATDKIPEETSAPAVSLDTTIIQEAVTSETSIRDSDIPTTLSQEITENTATSDNSISSVKTTPLANVETSSTIIPVVVNVNNESPTELSSLATENVSSVKPFDTSASQAPESDISTQKTTVPGTENAEESATTFIVPTTDAIDKAVSKVQAIVAEAGKELKGETTILPSEDNASETTIIPLTDVKNESIPVIIDKVIEKVDEIVKENAAESTTAIPTETPQTTFNSEVTEGTKASTTVKFDLHAPTTSEPSEAVDISSGEVVIATTEKTLASTGVSQETTEAVQTTKTIPVLIVEEKVTAAVSEDETTKSKPAFVTEGETQITSSPAAITEEATLTSTLSGINQSSDIKASTIPVTDEAVKVTPLEETIAITPESEKLTTIQAIETTDEATTETPITSPRPLSVGVVIRKKK